MLSEESQNSEKYCEVSPQSHNYVFSYLLLSTKFYLSPLLKEVPIYYIFGGGDVLDCVP